MSVLEIERPAAIVEDEASARAHDAPPTSPSLVLCAPYSRLVLVGLTFVALAIAAALDGGRLLLYVDGPIERFVVAHRTDVLDRVFKRISFFGSTPVVLAGGAVLAAAAWRRCRMIALLVVAATLSRPLVEFTLKLIVGRERPSLGRLVGGIGYSFPSGHPMAAATLWLLVPVVLSLYTRSRRAWWAATSASITAVALIGASRVYLGVHWATDVIAGALAAAVLLAALDLAFVTAHERRCCRGSRVTSATNGNG